MNSDPNAIKPLQFETATSSAPADAGQGVTCVACQRTILDKYYDVNAQSVCESCRDQIARLAETPRGWTVIGRAVLFGGVAAVLGAILYYAVIAITNFEIGIVAIAIGYMVGYGIRMGTRGRGGRRFQVMAVVLTYWAVGLAYAPIVFGELVKQDATEQTGTNTSASAEKPDPPDEPSAASLWLGLALLAGLTFALPIMSVVSSLPGGLISAAIIAFGMQQAWRMTAAAHATITGPYRIGAGPPAVA